MSSAASSRTNHVAGYARCPMHLSSICGLLRTAISNAYPSPIRRTTPVNETTQASGRRPAKHTHSKRLISRHSCPRTRGWSAARILRLSVCAFAPARSKPQPISHTVISLWTQSRLCLRKAWWRFRQVCLPGNGRAGIAYCATKHLQSGSGSAKFPCHFAKRGRRPVSILSRHGVGVPAPSPSNISFSVKRVRIATVPQT
jgi:hypothetical protein